jgi:beta-galactosidase/beta-glucuronidase
VNIPRNEYPRPLMVRKDWLCLNGTWQFEIDAGDSGLERGLKDKPLSGSITVPFCPESSLSGVGNTDFLNAVWYRREVTIPEAWSGRDVLLHFQACDYDTTVWVNGTEVVRHRGGWTPFSASLKGVAKPGDTCTIVVRARDPGREPSPGGKQSKQFHNHGCHYTRTTGIWQTVWMEPVSPAHMGRPRITPVLSAPRFDLVVPIIAFGESRKGHVVRAKLLKEGTPLASSESCVDLDFSAALSLPIPEGDVVLWEPGKPFLYDIELELLNASPPTPDCAASRSTASAC